MKKPTQPKIAIIHDSLRYFGGAERVLESFHGVFPKAQIYTSIICWERLGPFRSRIEKLKPITSWAQKISFFRLYPFLYRYLLPLIWQSLDLSSYDVVITLSHAQMSQLVKVSPNTVLISYCLSPPRHLYGYETDFPWQKINIIKFFANWGNKILLKKDQEAAERVSIFLAASNEVAQRIRRFYRRNATVIYPPLNRRRLEGKAFTGNYYLVVSRLSPMKHIDLIITACNKLKIPLKIVGVGPEETHLKSINGRNIQLLGQVSDTQLAHLYAGCRAVICAARDEDFGIVPVEAMSFGKPVIAYWSGGYKETVREGQTGIFFRELNPTSLKQALEKFQTLTFSAGSCRRRAHEFSRAIFKRRMRQTVLKAWQKSQFLKRMVEYDL